MAFKRSGVQLPSAPPSPASAPRGVPRRPSRAWILIAGVACVALAVLVLLPNLLAANLCAPDTAAIATLRNLASCQEEFRARVAVDSDGDGRGEFGWVRELTGDVPPRTAPDRKGRPVAPPILSPALRHVSTEGWVEKSHYAFAVFLPRAGGGWLREVGTAGALPAAPAEGCSTGGTTPSRPGGHAAAAGAIDPDRAEEAWCALAWPRMLGDRVRRTFLVTARGRVYQCRNEAGVTCSTSLPEGPDALLPAGWKPGDDLGTEFVSPGGERWTATD